MKKLFILPVFAILAFSVTAMAATDDGPPKKVWVCHFDGHTADTPWMGAGELLEGDYVVAYVEGMPLPIQVDYCESRGGHLIEIAATAAEYGHDAQLLDRIADYPER